MNPLNSIRLIVLDNNAYQKKNHNNNNDKIIEYVNLNGSYKIRALIQIFNFKIMCIPLPRVSKFEVNKDKVIFITIAVFTFLVYNRRQSGCYWGSFAFRSGLSDNQSEDFCILRKIKRTHCGS
jgi:hypothetical protein